MKNLLVKIKNNLKKRGLKKNLTVALPAIKARSLTEKKKIKLLAIQTSITGPMRKYQSWPSA